MAQKPDFYSILGASTTDTPEEIKKKHLGKMRQVHPDLNRNKSPEQITALLEKLIPNEEDRAYFKENKIYTLDGYSKFIGEAIRSIQNPSSSSGPSNDTDTTPSKPIRKRHAGESLEYFANLGDDDDNEEIVKPRETISREERRANRMKRAAGKTEHTSVPPLAKKKETPSQKENFDRVSEPVKKTPSYDTNDDLSASDLNDMRRELQTMRDRIDGMLDKVDQSIKNNKKNNFGF